LVEYYSPDVVVNQIRERFLIRPANDVVGINPSEAAFIKGFSIDPSLSLGLGKQKYSELFIQCLAKLSVKENKVYVQDLKALSKKIGLLPLFYYADSINTSNLNYDNVYSDLHTRLGEICNEISSSDFFDTKFVDIEIKSRKLSFHGCVYLDYLMFGQLFDFKSHPLFDGKQYLTRYTDVEEAGMNPLWHYERHGKTEGRTLA
jgi:hypothetical protein